MNGSKYLLNGAPQTCANCGQPFPIEEGCVRCWRASNGQHICTEFCADDAEEAAFQKQRRRSRIGPTDGRRIYNASAAR